MGWDVGLDRGKCAAIAMKLRRELLTKEKVLRSIDVRDETSHAEQRVHVLRPAETVDPLIPRLRHGSGIQRRSRSLSCRHRTTGWTLIWSG